jgi:hypothetical protein
MSQRGGRYYAIHTGNEVYSTLFTPRTENRTARTGNSPFSKQRNADLLACLDEAVAYIHRLKPRVSARIVAEIAQLKREGEQSQANVL